MEVVNIGLNVAAEEKSFSLSLRAKANNTKSHLVEIETTWNVVIGISTIRPFLFSLTKEYLMIGE